MFSGELHRQISDNTFQVKSVEQLGRIHKLMKLDLSVSSFEDAGATGDGEKRVLVSQVRSLNGNVTVFAEVEAVRSFEAFAFLLRNVLDQNAETCGDPDAFLEVSGVEFVSERDEVADAKLLWVLAEF